MPAFSNGSVMLGELGKWELNYRTRHLVF